MKTLIKKFIKIDKKRTLIISTILIGITIAIFVNNSNNNNQRPIKKQELNKKEQIEEIIEKQKKLSNMIPKKELAYPIKSEVYAKENIEHKSTKIITPTLEKRNDNNTFKTKLNKKESKNRQFYYFSPYNKTELEQKLNKYFKQKYNKRIVDFNIQKLEFNNKIKLVNVYVMIRRQGYENYYGNFTIYPESRAESVEELTQKIMNETNKMFKKQKKIKKIKKTSKLKIYKE